ncbi:lipoprotein signal peptidase [Thalassotalea insulae]|uniref:Lipoprotein signal peptidase n=1 Tax=Thalassotalea insulae TaxID=2056778 RepID=A0ABQ6GP85_9GAMM|nr:signal peptidase II [Thalassotalea insulae]GLX77167.1 lipoprotein signal peptidase [Thalassotalea insulae]
MSQVTNKSGLSWLWITLVCLLIDQITKHWVAGSMELHQSFEVLSFFNITYAQNPGAAFSFLADQPGWQRWFFTLIAVAASIVFLVWLKRTPKDHTVLAIALACMLSGALGNLIDRVLFGYVIDFLDFYIGSYHWPTFNIADSVIFIGAVLMIIDSFKQSNSENTHAVKEK